MNFTMDKENIKPEKKNTTSNIHKNHRQRMKSKFLKNPEILTDHELLEILLYYCIPLKNTNEQAHDLLNNSKNLKGLFDLPDSKLKQINGIGNETITFIKVLKELYIRTEKEKLDTKNERKITRNNISQKLHKLFFGLSYEKMIILCVDKDCNLINVHTVSEGNDCATVVPIKKIINYVLDDKATYVFLAHNHPNGVLAPSEADITATKNICQALALIDVAVIEHFIVCENSELGIIREAKIFKNKGKK